MILSRITRHVREQNWTAIGIDFVIVVLGVFLGIQLGNWNAARADRAEYGRALARLDAEIEDNLRALDALDPELARSLETVEAAFDALLTCTESEANRQAINAGLAEIRASAGMNLRRSALDEITTNPRLLAQESDAERKRFADLRYYTELMLDEADFAEHHPLGNRIENNPVLRIGEKAEVSWDYLGVDFSKIRRRLVLAVPVSEACRDDRLVKSFFTWEAWQSNLPVTARVVRNQMDQTRALLARRHP